MMILKSSFHLFGSFHGPSHRIDGADLCGFWLSDPIVGLIIVVYLVKEGVELMTESAESAPGAEI